MLGDFVTATTIEGDVRQGIIVEERPNHTFVLLGESGTRYTCRGKVRPIRGPIFAHTQQWINRVRKSLRKPR